MNLDDQLMAMALRLRVHDGPEEGEALETSAAYMRETVKYPDGLAEALETIRDATDTALQIILRHQNRL
ncbi:hypothetical protein [Micromonospora sp. WMMD1082]|uniref:hypothetical protein n=1 Tax=Micromonospora sp. WMMD1082 TaxID=3016104 RepID=UPI00241734AA|nr:hypothetical protein [Micromonospora sp. WMMD1082]MDG4796979.1 hypothetical protein [Micromonospora sp. WMMD1082]